MLLTLLQRRHLSVSVLDPTHTRLAALRELHEWHSGCKLEMSFVPPRDRGTVWSMVMAEGRPRAGGMPVANTADPPSRRLETLRQLQDLLRGDGGSRYVEEDALFDPYHPTYAVALDEESRSVSHGHHLESIWWSTWIVRSGLHLRERPVARGPLLHQDSAVVLEVEDEGQGLVCRLDLRWIVDLNHVRCPESRSNGSEGEIGLSCLKRGEVHAIE